MTKVWLIKTQRSYKLLRKFSRSDWVSSSGRWSLSTFRSQLSSLNSSSPSLKNISSILKVIGSTFYTFDNVGKGQEVKAINQILVAGSYAAVAEAISLGETLNLPMDKVVEALQTGAASSWALANRSKSMIFGCEIDDLWSPTRIKGTQM